jgi:SAM-dependent methyltransferase
MCQERNKTQQIDRLVDRIEEDFRKFSKTYKIYPPNPPLRKYAEDRISVERIQEQWSQLKSLTFGANSNLRLLEIGSGFGAFLNYASSQGVAAFGIEPELPQAHISHDLLKLTGEQDTVIINSVGEKSPFQNEMFDVVYSSNVLEHVENPEIVISEALRVLKPGGYLQFIIPNYGSWYDGHYQVLWFPNIPKFIAKVYVRILGRDPSFIDTLQLINRHQLEKILVKHDDCIEIIGWGEDVWESRVRTAVFSAWSGLGSLVRLMRLIHLLRLEEITIWLGKKFHWETPFILTLRKVRK